MIISYNNINKYIEDIKHLNVKNKIKYLLNCMNIYDVYNISNLFFFLF